MEIKGRAELPESEEPPPPPKEFEKKGYTRRRPKIRKEDVLHWGIAPGCPGCVAASRHAQARARAEECRARVEGRAAQEGDERME
eukprot:7069823-Alexandrium_andersonii.AAC.1